MKEARIREEEDGNERARGQKKDEKRRGMNRNKSGEGNGRLKEVVIKT